MVTIEEINAAITGRWPLSVESEVYVPVISEILPLLISLDTDHRGISLRQLGLLNDFLKHPPELLPQVKDALFGHMTEYDQLYTDDGQYPYADAEESWRAASAPWLSIQDQDDPSADYPILCFRPDWDPEHGAEIWFYEGRFRYR